MSQVYILGVLLFYISSGVYTIVENRARLAEQILENQVAACTMEIPSILRDDFDTDTSMMSECEQ